MDMPLSLIERLRLAASMWTEAQGSSFARLGRAVLNDGGFFTRIEGGASSTTTATLERFARFFADPANWPAGEVPEFVRDFVSVVGGVQQEFHPTGFTLEGAQDHVG